MRFVSRWGVIRCGFAEPHPTVWFWLQQYRTKSHYRTLKSKRAHYRTVRFLKIQSATNRDKPFGLFKSSTCYGAGKVRCGIKRFYLTALHRMVVLRKTKQNSTVATSVNKILTAPHRSILHIDKPHSDSLLHRVKPK